MRDLYGGVDVTKEYGMVVNGDSLDKILVNKTYLKKWINLAKQSKGVIICRYFRRIVLSSNLVFYSYFRATPSQKGALVKIVRQETNQQVLAIGWLHHQIYKYSLNNQ